MFLLGQLEIILIITLALSACSIVGSILIFQGAPYSPSSIGRISTFGFSIGFLYSSTLSSVPIILFSIITILLAQKLIKKLCEKTTISEGVLYIIISTILFAIGLVIMHIQTVNNFITTDKIFTGELVYTIINRITISGYDFGSVSLYLFSILLLINIVLFVINSNSFKIFFVDKTYYLNLNKNTELLELVISVMVSITVASTIQVTGSFIVSLFILGIPMITVYFVKRISTLVISAIAISTSVSFAGYSIAKILNISIVSVTAAIISSLLILSAFLAPERGAMALFFSNRIDRKNIMLTDLLNYIYEAGQISQPNQYQAITEDISDYMNWNLKYTTKIIKLASVKELVFTDTNGFLQLTETGIKQVNLINNR